jgi:hypothetical protein
MIAILSHPPSDGDEDEREEIQCQTDEGRKKQLNGLLRKGKGTARQQLKARVLLKADAAKNGPK